MVVTHYFLSFYCDSRQTSSFRSVQSQAQVFAAIGCNLTMSKGGQNVKNHNKKMSIFHAYFQILGGFCAEASARFDTLSLSKFDHR